MDTGLTTQPLHLAPRLQQFATVAKALLIAAGMAFLLGLLGAYGSRLELLSHFLEVYLLGAITAGLILLALRHWKWAFAAGMLTITLFTQAAPWYRPHGGVFADMPGNLRVMQANVNRSNQKRTAFVEEVRRAQPDIVSVQEVDFAWQEALTPLLDDYPYHVFEPRTDNFGIAMLSKLPLEETAVFYPANPEVPAIRARLKQGDATVHLLSIHTLPPGTRRSSETRNRQLLYISEWSRANAGPGIVMGDLNCTMWSPWYTRMMQGTALRDVRHGHGLLRTWPASLPLRIPIDYVLVQGEIAVLRANLGPDIGSDHLPLVVDLHVGAQ